jgi:tetratricopeptide (TPR) repeat protein
MLEVAARVKNRHDQVEMHIYRLIDLVALGDADGWERGLVTLQKLVASIGETFYEFSATTMRTAKILQTGDFAAAEKMALDGFAVGQQLGVDNAEGVLGIQMFTLRREQGRLREIAPILKQFVDDDASAAWRPGLALIFAELGQFDDARTELDRLALDEFAILPRDSLWQTSLAYLAEVCDYLQDTARAATLYRLLLPYAGHTVVVGNIVVCLGATSRFLGQLAALQGDWDAAERHFVHALELNARMDAAPWLAHTRYQYARMLKLRGQGDDWQRADELLEQSLAVAQSLGMQGLVERAGQG